MNKAINETSAFESANKESYPMHLASKVDKAVGLPTEIATIVNTQAGVAGAVI